MATLLKKLVLAGLDKIPLPGHGQTMQRWSALAAVAAFDLSLAKLYEAHTDALAICAELEAAPFHEHANVAQIWGVWCAESSAARLEIDDDPADGHTVTVSGLKNWCSGAEVATHGLVSAFDKEGRRWLLAIDLADPGICREPGQWHAVGMADTRTMLLRLDQAKAVCVGTAGAYLQRCGFWHGGIGIAACWYGAAVQIGAALRDKSLAAGDELRAAQLGAIDLALAGARAVLFDCAKAIDDRPGNDARLMACRARLLVESACVTVMQHAGEALGAAPFCHDRGFARLMADLPVFLRQSHGQRDRASLGAMVAGAAAQRQSSVMWEL